MFGSRSDNRANRRYTIVFTLFAAFAALAALLTPLRGSGVAAQADPTATSGTNSGATGGGLERESPYLGVNPYGTNVFLHKEVERPKVSKTLDMVQGASIKWIKQDFVWNDIEIHGKGDFEDRRNPNDVKSAWDKYDFIVNEAIARDITVVARVSFAPTWARTSGGGDNNKPDNYQDLADFIVAMLDHYQGKLKYIQVWNEPNLTYEWIDGGRVDPVGYTELLKTVYTAVKAKHPDVAILSAPMAINLETIDYAGNLNELDYWDQMYKAGAAQYFDILSANAYGLDQPPTDPPSPDKLNFRRVELLRQVMENNGDAAKPVWFNEYGWNASPTSLSQEQQLRWRRVDPETQAQWTVDGIKYAQDNWPWSGVFFIWYFRQVGDIQPDNAEYYFQLVNPKFEPQLVYRAVKDAAVAYAAQAGGTATPAVTADATSATEATATTTSGGGTTPAAATNTTAAVAPTNTTAAVAPTSTTAAAVATATTVVASGSGGGDNTIWFVVGGLLVLAGLGLAGFLATRRRSA